MAKTGSKKKKVDGNLDPSTLTGLRIYTDDKGRTIYYQPRTLTGYVISSTDVASYRTLSKRFVLGIIGIILTTLFTDELPYSWLISIAVGLGIYLFMEYRFRTKFLKSLVQLHNFIPKEKPSFLESLAKETIQRLLLKAVLYIAFGILLLADVYLDMKPDLFILVMIWVISIGAVFMGILNIYAIFYQKKHPEILIDPKQKSRKSKK